MRNRTPSFPCVRKRRPVPIAAILVAIAGSALPAQEKNNPETAKAGEVEVSTLKGDLYTGVIDGLNASTLTLESKSAKSEVPLTDVLEVLFPKADSTPGDVSRLSRVVLVDGSQITCSGVTVTGRSVSLKSAWLGEFQLPLAQISSIRFNLNSTQFDEHWKTISRGKSNTDLLAVPREKVLDPVRGVVGGIDEKQVLFLLDGEEIPVQREKVIGVVYARENANDSRLPCEVTFRNSDRLKVQSIRLSDTSFQAKLPSGVNVAFPLNSVQSLDFSAGKILYLSRTEPRDVEYTPFFDDEPERFLIQYCRDENKQGKPLRVGRKTYARGLWIHSKTILKYRIGGDYRRFQAVMGIDYAVASKGYGDVRVVIRGDGKTLLEADVKGTDEPRPVDLDVSGIRDLEITVDYGRDELSISDHLVLAEARVIK